MIEVQGLTRYYGRFPALQDVGFAIDSGQIVGLLGLNGAGKTTLLKILGGLLTPSRGRVAVAGVDALEAPEALRRKIGFLPEDTPLYRDMRVDEFLLWCGELRGRSKQQLRGDLPEVLQLCQLEGMQERRIAELSHGYKKRVGIAQAIIHRPDLVILDEPISGLDPVQIVEMRKVVRGLKDRSTVILSSHILSEISHSCDKLLVLHAGRVVAEGSEQELTHRVAGARRLVMGLRGQAEAISNQLRGLEWIADFTLGPVGDGNEGELELQVTLREDKREDLVRELVLAGVGLRRLGVAEVELEQVFMSLAKPEART